MKKTIYLIPGVGCDETVFKYLELPGYELVPIKWLSPHKHETLKEYVKRLLPQIKKDTAPVFIGLSFGGIVAIELSKLVKTHKVFIISSIKTYHERPYKMSMLYLLKFYRMFPASLAVKFGFWHRWALGDLNEAEKELVNDMLEKIDIRFNKWAVDQAIHWQNKDVPENLVHIHGDEDNIFPHIYIKNYHRIRGGTHFMIVRHARQISHIIMHELQKSEHAPRRIAPQIAPKREKKISRKKLKKRGFRKLIVKMKKRLSRRNKKLKRMRA
ncbi:MAG TPA: alpha/beta hydrolase [Chitinophagales bacterium]|nr:alpha/beta hydrolase [Chitinophagales bacterium]